MNQYNTNQRGAIGNELEEAEKNCPAIFLRFFQNYLNSISADRLHRMCITGTGIDAAGWIQANRADSFRTSDTSGMLPDSKCISESDPIVTQMFHEIEYE